MPQCFQLFRKGGSEALDLCLVDEEICKHLGVEVHPTRYVNYWFDSIGFSVACGKPLGSDELREDIRRYRDDDLLKILAYMEENYSSDAWYETGSRAG